MNQKNLFFLLVQTLVAATVQAQFSSQKTAIGSTPWPTCIYQVDLDNDGDIDILNSGYEDSFVGWFENIGNGVFTNHQVIDWEIEEPTSVTAADLDGDGLQDVLYISETDEYVAWNKNLGNGEFGPKNIIANSVSYFADIKTNDIDGDGDPDVFYYGTNNRVYLLENQGGANFNAPLDLGYYTGVTEIEFGDMNGSGEIDVVICGNPTNIGWLENLGSLTFGTYSVASVGYFNSAAMSVADIDGDLDLDIVVGGLDFSSTHQVAWYENSGGGVFLDHVTISTLVDEVVELYTADLDNNGIQDVISGSRADQKVAWYPSMGSGSFGVQQAFAEAHSNPTSVVTADLDGDFNQEIINVATWNDHISWYDNLGSGSFGPVDYIDFRQEEVRSVLGSDLNNDGLNDILYASTQGNLVAWNENLGNGTFREQQVISTTADISMEMLSVDMDGDLDQDILGISFLAQEIVWFENLGAGTFAVEQVLLNPSSNPSGLSYTDMDGDGLDDLVLAFYISDAVVWHKNLGGLVFGVEQSIGNSCDGPRSIHCQDLSDNGFMDVMVASEVDDKISWYENLGGGSFSAEQVLTTNANGAYDVYSEDLDGDGLFDVMSVSRLDNKASWFNNLGSGVFSGEKVLSTSLIDPMAIHAADLDGDNDIDIIIGEHSLAPTVRWFENLSNGNFSQAVPLVTRDRESQAVFACDLDNDADLDIISGTIGSVSWYENYYHQMGQMRGTVFIDFDQNGLKDSADLGTNLSQVVSNPATNSSFTYADGDYILLADYNSPGAYEIYPSDLTFWQITSDSLVYNVNIDSNFVERDSMDFGIFPDTLVDQVAVDLTGGFPRCNDTINYWLTVKNTGTTFPSGVLHLLLDDSVDFVSSTPVPDSIVGQDIYWSYDTLFFFSEDFINVKVQMPSFLSIGYQIHNDFNASIDSLGNSVFTTIDSLEHLVFCGYDPNDKISEIAGADSLGYVPLSTQQLDYTVRFQNTGNDTVFKVVIEDQLDPNLDWSSFVPVASSHPMQVDINPQGLVTFTLDNIVLPDSGANFLGSQGFVKYNIQLNTGLLHGTIIENQADIFFDLNPPILTNIKTNTLYDCQTVIQNSVYPTDICEGLTLEGVAADTFSTSLFEWIIDVNDTISSNQMSWSPTGTGQVDIVFKVNNGLCSADSAVQVFVSPAPGIADHGTGTVCFGDSTLFFNYYVSAPGVYFDTITSFYGCDSVITKEFVVGFPQLNTDPDIYICQGDSVLIYGNYETVEGPYSANLVGINGCDSLVSTNLIHYTSYSSSLPVENICTGDSILILGNYELTSGIYQDSLQTSYGCDSVTTQELIVNNNPIVSISPPSNDSLCLNWGAITLAGAPAGGVFSGTGITGNQFDPSLAGAGTHEIFYNYADINGCSSSDSLQIQVAGCLGLESSFFSEVTVHPNPFTDYTTITFGHKLEGEYDLKLYNSSGEVVLESLALTGGSFELLNDALSSGVYILTLVKNDGQIEAFRRRVVVY